MSDQPLPHPVPWPTRRLDAAAPKPVPASRPRCRALTADGHRCRNKVLGGLHLCFSHYRHRRPALPEPRKVSIPLLEDRSAIQLLTSQILQGILSGRLDPLSARVSLSALRLAALTVPGLILPIRSAPDAEAPGDPVCCLGRDHEDFISADGDLDEPPLNPSCSVAESADAARQLLDTLQPVSRCEPELEPDDPPALDPTHDAEHCACLTCQDFRKHIQERIEASRTASGG